VSMGGDMSSRFKAGLAAVLIGAAAVLGVLMAYLLRQGLDKASLWASVLGLPLTVIIAVSGVWTAVLAAKANREPALSSRTGSASGRGTQARTAVIRSGDIRQDHISGPAIAHTGVGDVFLTVPTAQKPPDEPA
jgi:hypothetical protein